MKMTVESTLYTDPQAAIPASYCPHCGGALYWPSCICVRCERSGDDPG